MRKIHQYKLRQMGKDFSGYLFKRAGKKNKGFYYKLTSGARGSIFAKEIQKYKALRPRKKDDKK